MKQDAQKLALFNCQMPPPRKCCLLVRTGPRSSLGLKTDCLFLQDKVLLQQLEALWFNACG